jgi:hypothetical protein
MQEVESGSIFLIANSIFPYGYDAVTVLSLPNGSFYRARFDEHFVSAQIRRDFSLMSKRKGLYCFRDYSSGKLTPLRMFTIEEINLIGKIYYIGYILGDILDFDQDEVVLGRQIEAFREKFSQQNTFFESGPGKDMYPLVLLSSTSVDFRGQTETVRGDIDRQTRCWSAIVRYLGQYSYFRYTPFFRIVGVRELGKKNFSMLTPRVNLKGDTDYQLQLVHNLQSDSPIPHSINEDRTDREERFLERASYQLQLFATQKAVLLARDITTVTGSYDISFFTFRTADILEQTPARLWIDYVLKPEQLQRLDTRISFEINVLPKFGVPWKRVILLIILGMIYFVPNLFPNVLQYTKFSPRVLQDLSVIAISLTAFDILNEIRRYLAN